jgi:hypothetical protein
LEVASGGVTVRGGSGLVVTAGGPRAPGDAGSGGGSGAAAGGLTVALAAADGVDADLAALGFGGNSGGPVGVSFEHRALLTVGAPPVTMADLMGSDGERRV